MNLPWFVYAKAFWEALSYAVAGVLALLVFFGVVDPQWALSAGAVLALFLTVLKWFGIEPELRLKALEREVQSLRNELQYFLSTKEAAKPAKKLNK